MTKTFLRHEQCPKCGSKDNLGVYDNGNGQLYSVCYSTDCGYYAYSDDTGTDERLVEPVVNNKANQTTNDFRRATDFLGEFKALPERRIKEDTMRKYGVKVDESDRHFYPYYDDQQELSGGKIRSSDKMFRTTGDMKHNTLFGQQLFKGGGKYVTVVEGELDALSAYEMLGSRWAVVSVSKGSAGAQRDIKNNLEWLESFENVVFIFDNDEAGNKAVQACAPLLSPNKAKIVRLEQGKDASDYSQAGKSKAFVDEWWNAKPYIVTGVLELGDAWEDFVSRGTEEVMPFPDSFGMLNSMLNGGIAQGEVTVIGALTSVGKSTMMTEVLYNFWKNTDKKIGCVFLEATKGETVENLLSVHTNHNLSFEDKEFIDYDKLHQSFLELTQDPRIYILDHHGAVDTDELFMKLRSMIKGNGCDIVIIDPLQAGVTSNSNDVVDDFMDRVLKLCKETNASVIIVSHMRKPSVTNPHNVSEYDLKGTGAINQISFNTILLSRDKMSEDEYNRNSTKVQVVKCRRTGITGVAGWIYYNSETSRLEQGEEPEVHEANQVGDF